MQNYGRMHFIRKDCELKEREKLVKDNKKRVNFCLVILGALLFAIDTKYINDPAGLVTGGVSGLSIILKKVTGVLIPGGLPLWAGSVLLNVPILIYVCRVRNFSSVIKCGAVWLLQTFFLFILPDRSFFKDDLFLTALSGGLLCGTASGMIFMAGFQGEGTDILGATMIMHIDALKKYKVATVVSVIDGLVVLTGAFVFGIKHTMYALISVLLFQKAMDFILSYGMDTKIVLIMSKYSENVSEQILHGIGRGVTSVNCTGMYSGSGYQMLMCICSGKESGDIKEIVRQEDRDAFMVVGHVKEALGEGFAQL